MTIQRPWCRRASRPAVSLFVFCSLLAVSLLVSCSATRKVRSAFGGALPIEVAIVPAANEDTPIAVDLVVVYDAKLVDELLKMPAAEWFRKKEQYAADHPAVAVTSWEWVPGQSVEPFKVSYRSGARSVVIFADYQTEGEHREVVGAPKPFRLILGERDLSVEVSP